MPTPVIVRSLSAALLGGVLASTLVACSDDAEKVADNVCSADNEVAKGFQAIDEDELGETLAESRREAGTWAYQYVTTSSAAPGKQEQSIGKVAWDGERVDWTFGVPGFEDVFLVSEGEWYWKDPRDADAKRPWVHFDPADQPDVSRRSMEAIANAVNPERQMDMLDDPLECEVMGLDASVAAVHYRLTLDVEKVQEAMGAPVVGNVGDRRVYEIWVDQDDQLVKLLEKSKTGELETTTTKTYTGFGDEQEITIPPKKLTREGDIPAPEAD